MAYIFICYLLMICVVFSLRNRLLSSHRNFGFQRMYLNRIIAEKEELQITPDYEKAILTLASEDYRFKHINKILKLKKHDNIRIGILNVGMFDFSTVSALDKDKIQIDVCDKSLLNTETILEKPLVDLMLAVPRPLRLERLLPVISMMGVRKLILIDAEKVEKDFFGYFVLFYFDCI